MEKHVENIEDIGEVMDVKVGDKEHSLVQSFVVGYTDVTLSAEHYESCLSQNFKVKETNELVEECRECGTMVKMI